MYGKCIQNHALCKLALQQIELNRQLQNQLLQLRDEHQSIIQSLRDAHVLIERHTESCVKMAANEVCGCGCVCSFCAYVHISIVCNSMDSIVVMSLLAIYQAGLQKELDSKQDRLNALEENLKASTIMCDTLEDTLNQQRQKVCVCVCWV